MAILKGTILPLIFPSTKYRNIRRTIVVPYIWHDCMTLSVEDFEAPNQDIQRRPPSQLISCKPIMLKKKCVYTNGYSCTHTRVYNINNIYIYIYTSIYLIILFLYVYTHNEFNQRPGCEPASHIIWATFLLDTQKQWLVVVI